MSEKVRIYRPELLPKDDISLAALSGLEKTTVSGEGTNTEVYRVLCGDCEYYLKVVRQERIARLLPRLLSARVWMSSVALEADVLAGLRQLGFETIPVVAAGTVYRWGWPTAGFMLSQSLPLPSLETVLKDGGDGAIPIWEAYGALVARLQRSGCTEPLRAKDILYDDVGSRYVLLDREKPLSKRRTLSKKRQQRLVDRAFYRNRRSGLNASDREAQAFFRGLSSGGEWPGQPASATK